MNQPAVCAIMLTRDRPEMAKRAVECFRTQTYPNKSLSIFSSAPELCGLPVKIVNRVEPATIGEMRNEANLRIRDMEYEGKPVAAEFIPDILIHWDDDDWSHPSRIAEQVALLQASGADAVGYNEMLFWREPTQAGLRIGPGSVEYFGQAWIYRGTILGTSLCYWRSAWERRPFEAKSRGEDTTWLQGVKSKGVSSFVGCSIAVPLIDVSAGGLAGPISTHREYVAGIPEVHGKPRMIAGIHGGNTSDAYDEYSMLEAPHHWRRAPEWDNYCAEAMA